jgi:hypothetical protein
MSHPVKATRTYGICRKELSFDRHLPLDMDRTSVVIRPLSRHRRRGTVGRMRSTSDGGIRDRRRRGARRSATSGSAQRRRRVAGRRPRQAGQRRGAKAQSRASSGLSPSPPPQARTGALAARADVMPARALGRGMSLGYGGVIGRCRQPQHSRASAAVGLPSAVRADPTPPGSIVVGGAEPGPAQRSPLTRDSSETRVMTHRRKEHQCALPYG